MKLPKELNIVCHIRLAKHVENDIVIVNFSYMSFFIDKDIVKFYISYFIKLCINLNFHARNKRHNHI